MQKLISLDNNGFYLPPTTGTFLTTGLARSEQDVRASQHLRYRIFAHEMGAKLKGQTHLDCDHYDAFCHHLLVRDTNTGAVVGSTRILTDTQAVKAGGFYAQSEFELHNILSLPGRIMEVGRTCIDPAYRNGAAIGVLWAGLARFMAIHHFDYMIGCASISLRAEPSVLHRLMQRLQQRHFAPDDLRVKPRLPLCEDGQTITVYDDAATITIPPLLKAYLRLGAYVCGDACLDPDFNVADVFILLDVDNIPLRYQRHFMRTEGMQRSVSATPDVKDFSCEASKA